MATVTSPVVALGIVKVLGATCSNPDCGFHESLHTANPIEARRTAKELGWQLKANGQAYCPMCNNTDDDPRPGVRRRRAKLQRLGKAVRA